MEGPAHQRGLHQYQGQVDCQLEQTGALPPEVLRTLRLQVEAMEIEKRSRSRQRQLRCPLEELELMHPNLARELVRRQRASSGQPNDPTSPSPQA